MDTVYTKPIRSQRLFKRNSKRITGLFFQIPPEFMSMLTHDHEFGYLFSHPKTIWRTKDSPPYLSPGRARYP